MKPNNWLVSLSVVVLICAGRLMADDVSTVSSRADIEKIVREYILQHPEVLLESVQSHRDRERVEAQASSKDAIAANRRELFDNTSSPAAGTPAAEVTVVQFFDYKCGYCRRVAPTVSKLLESHKNVRVIFKELPILGPESQIAARAALAAAQQDAYVAFHRELMNWNGPVTPEAIEDIGRKLGLDVARLKADMHSKEIDLALAQNGNLANAIGVQSTPAFVIGGELISGAMDLTAFEKRISNNSN
jgi:protein-disulfide isomerase